MTLLCFRAGTPSFTGEPVPAFLSLATAHPPKHQIAGGPEWIRLGAVITKPEDVTALAAQLRADIEAFEAVAKMHFR